MNMREGMRRVGIVLAALGCVAGGAIGYWNLQDVWNSHTRFERLQALPVMLDANAAIKDYQARQHGRGDSSSIGSPIQIDPRTGERVGDSAIQIDPSTGERIGRKQVIITPDKIVEVPGVGNLSFPGGMSDDKIAEAIKSHLAQHRTQQFTIKPPVPPPPPGYTLDTPASKIQIFDMSKAVPIGGAPSGVTVDMSKAVPIPPGVTITPDAPDFIPYYTAQAAYPRDKAVADDPSAEIMVDVKGTDGIQTVNADTAGAISSIQLTTGEWVRRGAKTLKARLAFIASLLLPFCYLVIGFLVPWGTIRVFVWVAGGFSARQSSS